MEKKEAMVIDVNRAVEEIEGTRRRLEFSTIGTKRFSQYNSCTRP